MLLLEADARPHPRSDGLDWLSYGGLETLPLSYGVPLKGYPDTRSARRGSEAAPPRGCPAAAPFRNLA